MTLNKSSLIGANYIHKHKLIDLLKVIEQIIEHKYIVYLGCVCLSMHKNDGSLMFKSINVFNHVVR